MGGAGLGLESNHRLIWRGACGSLRIGILPGRTCPEAVRWIIGGEPELTLTMRRAVPSLDLPALHME